jgi:hypothetical protein
MKYIKLETGYSNEPVIDIERIISFQSFVFDSTLQNSNHCGELKVFYFGGTDITFHFKEKELAHKAYADMCVLLNVVSSATAVIQTPKPPN